MSGWERLRVRRRSLAAAAATTDGLATGPETPRPPGSDDPFADGHDLAAAAQQEWWLGALARIDARLDDNLPAMAPGARFDAVSDAWNEHVRATPGYLRLAALGAGDGQHEATGRRYARLLALFSGRADVADDYDHAADAGLDLVRELSGSTSVVTAVA